MATLKIVGYETGEKKQQVAALLQDRLGLEGDEAQKMLEAVNDGRGVTMTFEDEETAAGLGQELIEAGALVTVE